MVYLHDYPLGGGNYYVREDGTILSPFVDTADGLCKSALPELAAYCRWYADRYMEFVKRRPTYAESGLPEVLRAAGAGRKAVVSWGHGVSRVVVV